MEPYLHNKSMCKASRMRNYLQANGYACVQADQSMDTLLKQHKCMHTLTHSDTAAAYRTVWGLGRKRTITSVTTPRVPSEPITI